MKKCQLHNQAYSFNFSPAKKISIFPFCVDLHCGLGLFSWTTSSRPVFRHLHSDIRATLFQSSSQRDRSCLCPGFNNHLYFHYNWCYLLWETLQRLLSQWCKALGFKQLKQLQYMSQKGDVQCIHLQSRCILQQPLYIVVIYNSVEDLGNSYQYESNSELASMVTSQQIFIGKHHMIRARNPPSPPFQLLQKRQSVREKSSFGLHTESPRLF